MAIDLKLRIKDIKNLQPILEVITGAADILSLEYLPDDMPEKKRPGATGITRHRLTSPAPVQFAQMLLAEQPKLVTGPYMRRWCERNHLAASSASSMMSVLASDGVLIREEGKKASCTVAPVASWPAKYRKENV